VLPLLRAHPEASAHAAHTGSGKHAVSYMAPELFGGGVVEPAADLYAAGALLHHMTTGAPPSIWTTDTGFDDLPGLPDVIRRAMAKHPIQRYPDASSMRTALEWIEVESANQNPQTQDIAPWMETSRIGSIPASALNTSRPPAHASSSHPAGKILSTSGARPIPIAPVIVEELDLDASRHWVRLALLLMLLGTLAFAGYWFGAGGGATDAQVPLGLEAEANRVR
jgi:serine/threonine protein kinase